MPAPPASTQIKTFEMGTHQLVFHFAGTEAEECFVIESVTGTGSGSVLLLRASGATTTKAPLRIETRGTFAMSVDADGKVAIGSESVTSSHKVGVLNANSSIGSLILQDSIPSAGSARNALTLSLSDNTTTSHSGYYGINIGYSKTAVQSSAPAYLLHINPSSIAESLSALTSINLRAPGVLAGKTLTTWRGIHIASVALGGTTTNNYAMTVESGAGNVGLGTSAPTVQLHVVGAMHDEQGTGQVFTIAKTHNTETAQLDFKRTQATGLYLNDDDLAGRIMFYGWFSPAWKALGYVQTTFDTNYGNAGLITMGAGDFGNARVEVLQTDGGTGGVTIYGAASTPWFAVTSVGHLFSHGTTGSMYYRNAAGYFVNLDIDFDPTGGTDVGKVLTVTDVSGNLYPRWMTPSGTPGTGEPALPVSTLQYNNAGSFGAVSNSLVSGAAVTLGGSLTIRNGASSADQNILLDAVSANPTRLIFTDYRDAATGSQITWERGRLSGGVHTDLTTNNVVARFLWKGQIPTTGLTQLAFMHGYYTTDYGASAGVLELGAGGFTLARIFILQGTGVGSNGGVTIYGGAATPYFQVDSAGFKFSSGTNGSMYFRHSSGYFNATASPSSADSIPYWDNSEGVVAYMTIGTGLSITGTAPNQILTATSSGGTPAGTGSELQYRNAGAFGAVSTSSVGVTGNIGIGTITAPPVLRLHVVGGAQIEAAGFIFQVQTAGFYFSSGLTGSVYYKDSFGYFVPTGTGLSNQYLKGGSAPSWGYVTATGSSTELQCRDSGTGAFAAVASSSVDGSGNVTLGGGTLTVQNNTATVLSMKIASTSVGPVLYTERSRGTLTSKSGIFAGDALLTVSNFGYDSTATPVARQGVAMDFTAQATFTSTSAPTVLRLRTTPVNSIIPAGRMIVGACRTLANNTLTDLFTITYGASDQSAMGGEIHLVIVAKGSIIGGAHDGVNIFVHRRVISFAIAHNKNNDMQVTFTEVQAHRSGGASDDTGLTAISHALNFDGAVGTGTNIPSTPNAYATNAITYKILATAVPNMTSVSQLICYYNIFYHGEGELAVAAS